MKNNKNNNQIMSVLFSLLVMLIPLHLSLSVSAQWAPAPPSSYTGTFVSIVGVEGEDGIPDYRRKLDRTTIVTYASLGSGSTVTPENVEFSIGGFLLGKADTCNQVSAQASVYQCTFTQVEGSGALTGGSQLIEARLVNGTTFLALAQGSIEVDGLAPKKTYFTLSSSRTSNSNITASFAIRDYSSGLRPGIGIKEIKLSVDGNIAYTFPEESSTDNDEYDVLLARKYVEKINIPLALGEESREYEVCLFGSDYFDQSFEECLTTTIDKNAPEILTDTFSVTATDGRDLTWIDSSSFPLTIKLHFSGKDLDKNSIRGDFTDLNPTASSVTPVCSTLANNVYSCEFRVSAKINASRGYQFKFVAEDDLGNTVDATITHPFTYDGLGPEALRYSGITYPIPYNGRNYIGKTPFTLLIDFRDEGIGMNTSQAYLDLSQIGLGNNIKTTGCEPSWTCSWDQIHAKDTPLDLAKITKEVEGENVTVEARDARFYVLSNTQDDLGNKGARKGFDITVDIFDPVIENVTLQLIPSTGNFLVEEEGFTVAGDFYDIIIEVSDATPVTMVVDGDDFISDFLEDFPCQDNGETQTCTHRFGPISNPGYYEGSFDITLTDMVNNSIKIETEPIEVYEVINETSDFWDAQNKGCNPNPLDRELVDRLESNIFCETELIPKQSNVEIFDISEGDCRDLNLSTLSNFNWLGTSRTSTSLYINLVTTSFDSDINLLRYQCQLNIKSIVDGTKITQSFEKVNATYEIELFNQPTGQVSAELEKRVDDIYNEYIDGGFGIVGYLGAFVDLSKTLCQILDLLTNISMGLKQLGKVLGLLTGSLKATAEGTAVVGGTTLYPVIESTNAAGKGTDILGFSLDGILGGSIGNILSKYCAFVNCKLAYGEWHEMWLETVDETIDLLTGQFLIDAIDLQGSFGSSLTSSSSESSSEPTSGAENAIHINDNSITVAAVSEITGNQIAPLRGEISEEEKEDNSDSNDDEDSNEDNNNKDKKGEGSQAGLFDDVRDVSGQFNYGGISPYDNWVLSIVTLCVPAMIFNLEKYRQIQCQYGDCLISQGESSLPTEVCSANKAWAECQFFYGSLFQFIPFAQFLSMVQEVIIQIMSDPIALVGAALEFACNSNWVLKTTSCSIAGVSHVCTSNVGLYYVCEFYNTFTFFSALVEQVRSIGDQEYSYDFGPGHGLCGDFSNAYDEFKNPEKT